MTTTNLPDDLRTPAHTLTFAELNIQRHRAADVLENLRAENAAVLDLPDAEHIHLTRRPDGSIASAVPMVLAIPEHDEPGDADAWWVDAPEQGDDR